MASQNMNREYDVTFINPPPPEVQTECPICHCVLFRPRMATCQCGYSYCAACINRVERDGKPCPLCNQPFGLVDDNRLERILNGYDVYCPRKEKGCKWKGELGKLEHHLNRNSLPDKQLEGCQFQEIKCGLCQMYHCERQLMSSHVLDKCQNRDIECEYRCVGCDFKKPQPHLEEHMKDSMGLHLSLLSNHMQNNFSLKEKEVHELKDELKKGKDAIQDIKQDLDGLKEVLRTQKRVIKSIMIIFGTIFAILFCILVFSSNWYIESLMLKMEETLSTQQQTSGLESNHLLDLKKQYESCRLQGESLRKETQEQFSKMKIDLKAQHESCRLQIESLKEKVEQTLLTQEQVNISLLNLKAQHESCRLQVESLREKIEETLSTQVNRVENSLLDLKAQHEKCRFQVESLSEKVEKALSIKKLESNQQQDKLKTNCTCPSFSGSEFKIIKQEVEYLRQQTDYPSLPVRIEFSELQKAESGDYLLSMPFYACASISCTYGYLMRLVVYPKGTGRVTRLTTYSMYSTRMAAYIHLLRGKYDSILNWPFRGVVRVTLHYVHGYFGDIQDVSRTFNFSDAGDLGARVINGTMSVNGLGDSYSFAPQDEESAYFTIESLVPVITIYHLVAMIPDILGAVGIIIYTFAMSYIVYKFC